MIKPHEQRGKFEVSNAYDNAIPTAPTVRMHVAAIERLPIMDGVILNQRCSNDNP